MEQMKKLIPGGRVSHANFLNPDTLAANILIPDTIREEDDSDYGGMVSIGNCEIGKRRFSQTPSVFRAICMNGCIWDQTKGKAIRQVHRGTIDYEVLGEQLKKNITSQIPLVTAGIDTLLTTREFGLDNVSIKNALAQVALDNSFSGKATVELFRAFAEENTEKNAFGIINAITRSGQKTDDPLVWVSHDEIAGRFTDETYWNRFKKRAAGMDDKKFEKVMSTAI